MKKLIKGLFILTSMTILIIVLIPVVLLTVMFKNDNIPYEEVTSNKGFNSVFKESIDNFLINEDKDFLVEINQEHLNSGLFSMIKENIINIPDINPHYLDDDSLENQYLYNINGTNGIKGIYTRLEGNEITINVPADYTVYNFFTMKTTITLRLSLSINKDLDVFLQIKEVSVGNLSVLPFLSVVDFIFDKITGESISDMLEDHIPYGHFDYKSKTYSLTFDEYKALIIDSANQSGELISMILDVLIEEKLFSLGLNDSRLHLKLDFNRVKAKAKMPFTKYDDEGLQRLLEARSSMLFFSAINSSDNKVNLNFSQDDLNGFIASKFTSQFSSGENQTFDLLGDTYLLGLNKDHPIYISFDNNKITISIEIVLEKEGSTGSFATEILFDSILELSENKEDILIELKSVRLGELSFEDNPMLSDKVFNQVFDLMRSTGLNLDSNNRIVLEGICTELSNNSGTTLLSVFVRDTEFILELEIIENEILEKIQEKMEDILDYVNKNSDLPLDDLSTSMTNEEFEEMIQELTPEQQQDLFDIIFEQLQEGDNPISLEELEKLIPHLQGRLAEFDF